MTTALRPLTTGELLDRTFSLYRSHFALFVGIIALPHLLVLGLRLVSVGFVFAGGASAVLGAVLWIPVFLVAYLIAAAASQAATIVAVSQVHLERPTSVMDSYARVKGRILPVIGIMIGVGIAVGIGFILLIVPGVILALMWSLTVPVAVLENKGMSESVSRSAELAKGDWGRIFVVYLLILILSIAVSAVIEWPIVLLVQAARGTTAIGLTQLAGAVANFISQCLVGPLMTIALSLIYYDERVRKEAFDLQLMMATLDGPQAGAASAV